MVELVYHLDRRRKSADFVAVSVIALVLLLHVFGEPLSDGSEPGMVAGHTPF